MRSVKLYKKKIITDLRSNDFEIKMLIEFQVSHVSNVLDYFVVQLGRMFSVLAFKHVEAKT